MMCTPCDLPSASRKRANKTNGAVVRNNNTERRNNKRNTSAPSKNNKRQKRSNTKQKIEEEDEDEGEDEEEEEEEVEEKYASSSYWDKRYESKEYHEWYYNYDDLKPIFDVAIQHNGNRNKSLDILEIGCGDAPLLPSFAADGYTGNLHGIDFSTSIIKELQDKAKEAASKPGKSNSNSSSSSNYANNVKYSVMDARNLEFESNTFDVVLDKGTIDAMFCGENINLSKATVTRILTEAVRVLNTTKGHLSVFILVSHIQVESMEFNVLFQDILIPILQHHQPEDNSSASCRVAWQIIAHTHTDAPTVYVIKAIPKRFTRTSLQEDWIYPVDVKVLSYDDDEEDVDSEDDDEEVEEEE